MGRVDICRSGTLDASVQALIAEAGGRAKAVLALMERAEAEATAPPARDDGTLTVVVVRLTADEARAIAAEHTARGMSRAEWVRAVLRRQVSAQRRLSRVDRGYLRKAASELQALRQELTRMRCAVTQMAMQGCDVERSLSRINGFERKLLAVAEAIRHGFLGDDAYWGRLQQTTDSADD